MCSTSIRPGRCEMGTLVTDANGVIICHRVWFKIILNPILRKLQFWTEWPYVITSIIEDGKVLGYRIARVRLRRDGCIGSQQTSTTTM